MKRLTKRYTSHIAVVCDNCEEKGSYCDTSVCCDVMRNRLAEYEEAEEQGLLVWLPCKVGDTVYKLCPISGFLNIGDRWDGRIITGDCDRCEWCCCDCYDIAPMFDGHHRNIVHEIKNISLKTIIQIMPHFGRTIFLTREAAEKALEEV